MSRIGILTFHRACNFGANLQAYSTKLYLESLGHDVYIIDYERDNDRAYKNKICQLQLNTHINFIKTKLSLTEKIEKSESIVNIIKKYNFDFVLIGSDAVWNKSSNKDYEYFAHWAVSNSIVENLKICTVSAAIMNIDYTKNDINIISNCLKNFNVITVRDVYTYNFIRRTGYRNPIYINPDPVILLSSLIKDNWKETKELQDKKYILMSLPKNWYMNGRIPKLVKWFYEFKEEINNKGYYLVELPIPEGTSGAPFDYTISYPIDPIQWFLTIKHAKGFCGVRFHSIVTCISNEVPFFSIDNYSGSNPIISRLKYNFRLYPLIQKYENKSKIANLLKGSGFEKYRISTGINVIDTKELLNKILEMDINKLSIFKNQQINKFKENIKHILS